MNDLPHTLTPGEVVQVSRIYRHHKKSLEEVGRDLGIFLAELDRRGFDVEITVRRKRGRPSNVSRFLARQGDLLSESALSAPQKRTASSE